MSIIIGDCIEKLKNIKDNSIDLVVTSPPYNNWRNHRTQKRKEKISKRNISNCIWKGENLPYILEEEVEKR